MDLKEIITKSKIITKLLIPILSWSYSCSHQINFVKYEDLPNHTKGFYDMNDNGKFEEGIDAVFVSEDTDGDKKNDRIYLFLIREFKGYTEKGNKYDLVIFHNPYWLLVDTDNDGVMEIHKINKVGDEGAPSIPLDDLIIHMRLRDDY